MTEFSANDLTRIFEKCEGFGPSSDYDLNGQKMSSNDGLRDAAVLIGLQDSPNGWNIILTKRSSALKHHPGQIAFPGGKRDDADDGLAATAQREAFEEIALAKQDAKIIGQLPSHETVTRFLVTPFVALVDQGFVPKPNVSEVAECFTLPLRHLTHPENFAVQSRLWRGEERYFYTLPHGPYYIWGATARMLRLMADVMEAGA